MHLSKLIHTPTGRIILSILLGLGLSSIFRTVCKDKNCIIFQAPKLNEVEGKIFKQDNKCYTFKAESTKCNLSKKNVRFE